MKPTVPTLIGLTVAILGFLWMIFSDVAPIGFAFFITGIALVMLSQKR